MNFFDWFLALLSGVALGFVIATTRDWRVVLLCFIFALFLLAAPKIDPKMEQLGRSLGDWLANQNMRILNKRKNRP
ncbi:hypothetical protein NDI52_27565 [Leptolyngbya sp. PL-A3]|uniref:hypothetical protein n=1 Tax=Leptolyngbya sp. PL-A3 TaxID=2933911 RepID=UPI003298EBD3